MIIDQRLQEFNLGTMENCRFADDCNVDNLIQSYMSIYSGFVKPEGADSPTSFRDRIFDSINELPHGNSAIFCHSGVLKNFLMMSTYELNYFGNLGMVLLECDDIYTESNIIGVFKGFENKI